MEQAKRIAAESSRYNVGVLRRTINVPVMSLVFLEPDVQPRFRFARVANGEPPPRCRPGRRGISSSRPRYG